MANIYKIFNNELEVHRAIKLMHPNLSEDSRRHFETEMKIMAGLSHPNIIEIHSVGLWNTLPYIEMEYLAGSTLDTMIKKRGALDVVVCTSIAILVARALAYAHNRNYLLYGTSYHGIIHRDLKPSNIMVTPDGIVKLMDFGIARPIEVSLFTTDGAIMGTMQYLAPEQLDGKPAEVAGDIYSFGTVLYEMLSGNKAFPQVSMSRLMSCKVKNDFRPLNEYSLKIPKPLCKLVHRCMMHDKKKRIGSAEALLAQLERIHNSLTLDTPEQVMRQYMSIPPGERTVLKVRRRSPWPLVAAAAGAVIVVGVGTINIVRTPAERAAAVEPSRTGSEKEQTEALPENSSPQQEDPFNIEARQTASGLSASNHSASRDPAVPAPSRPDKERQSPLEKLQERYGSNNQLTIFYGEVENGNFASAHRLWNHLGQNAQSEKKAAIYYMRVLRTLGKSSELSRFLRSHKIADGEFILQNAIGSLHSGQTDKALSLLEKAIATPAEYLPSSRLRTDYLYYRALAKSKSFTNSDNQSTLSAAMDAWFEVRNFLQNNREHPYHQKAIQEMQRLARSRK